MKKNNINQAEILTFHFVTNYGAILQTFALQKTLEKYYNQVNILNYEPLSMTSEEKIINFSSWKSVIDTIYSAKSFMKRKKQFKKFRRKYLYETQLYKKNEQICNLENTDLYIGSDQVWNFDIIKNDLTYFGEFKNTTPKNIFSYAASIGNSKISQKNKDKIIKLLKNFQKISIREESARKMLDESPKIDVVLDPTLLLSKNEWEKALNLNTVQNKPYIFLYTLEARSETLKCAQNLSKKLNLPIIEISGKRKSLKRLEKHKIFYDASPYQFVKLLSNASFVITESFHATSLSIIFEKKFITTIHKTRGSRISDLLNKVNLIERYSNEVTDSLINDKIDYKNVKKLIAKYQRESLNYIKECVKK